MRKDIKQHGWIVAVCGERIVPLTGTGMMPAVFATRGEARSWKQCQEAHGLRHLKVLPAGVRLEIDVAA